MLRAIAPCSVRSPGPGWYLVGADAEYAHTPFALAEEQFLQAAEQRRRAGLADLPHLGAR